MDFITIDFETASSEANSPCEIGMTFVRNGIVQDTYSRLIRPPGNRYNFWNIKVHGIRPEETKHEPSFADLWPEIEPLINGHFMVAHNASFDFSVLRKTLDFYGFKMPDVRYACSVQLSKKIWPGLPKYNLKAMCDMHNINLNHHRAEADSLATAELCIKAFDFAEISSVEEIRHKLSTHVWQMLPHGNVRMGLKKNTKTKKPSPELVSRINPDSIFYQKRVAFTGELSTMRRGAALQEILDLGGFPDEAVTPETDFLVVGSHRLSRKIPDYRSYKEKAAVNFMMQGSSIRMISEPEFIHQIDVQKGVM